VSPSHRFERGHLYTRIGIQQIVGGEIQTYLPQKAGRILAGCFSKDMNPGAPFIVQVGNAAKVARKADLLALQPDTVFPVFTKGRRRDTHYRYEGCFRFDRLSAERADIAAAESESGRLDELVYVLRLARVR